MRILRQATNLVMCIAMMENPPPGTPSSQAAPQTAASAVKASGDALSAELGRAYGSSSPAEPFISVQDNRMSSQRVTDVKAVTFGGPHLAAVFTKAARWGAEFDDDVLTVVALSLNYYDKQAQADGASPVELTAIFDGHSLTAHSPRL